MKILLAILARSGSGDHVAVKALAASPPAGNPPVPVIIKTDVFRKAFEGSEYDAEAMIARPIPAEGRELCLDVSELAYELLTKPCVD